MEGFFDLSNSKAFKAFFENPDMAAGFINLFNKHQFIFDFEVKPSYIEVVESDLSSIGFNTSVSLQIKNSLNKLLLVLLSASDYLEDEKEYLNKTIQANRTIFDDENMDDSSINDRAYTIFFIIDKDKKITTQANFYKVQRCLRVGEDSVKLLYNTRIFTILILSFEESPSKEVYEFSRLFDLSDGYCPKEGLALAGYRFLEKL